MSNLITTTRDAGRNAVITGYFGVRRAGHVLADRAKDPTGQTAAEYMGVLLVVSVIIAGVAQTHIGDQIVEKMKSLIDDIAGGTSGTDG